MPTLAVTFSQREMREVKRRAGAAGFSAPDVWVRSIVDGKLFDDEEVTEEAVLRWSREAKRLKREGRLPILHSIRELRQRRHRAV